MQDISKESDSFFNIKQAAQFLNLRISRLRTAILRKEIPFIKVGRLVRFKKSALEAWATAKTSEVKNEK